MGKFNIDKIKIQCNVACSTCNKKNYTRIQTRSAPVTRKVPEKFQCKACKSHRIKVDYEVKYQPDYFSTLQTVGSASIDEVFSSEFMLENLLVKPEYRRFGIGKRLVEKIVKTAGAKGNIHLNIVPFGKVKGPQDPELEQFYSKFGFKNTTAKGAWIIEMSRPKS